MLSVHFGINFDKQLIDTERIFDLGVILHKNNNALSNMLNALVLLKLE